MADYSKEYLTLAGLPGKDFSLVKLAKKLKEGEAMPVICEGFGTRAVGKFNGASIVLLMDDTEVPLLELINDQSYTAHHQH